MAGTKENRVAMLRSEDYSNIEFMKDYIIPAIQ
jgi:hypothetical protein